MNALRAKYGHAIDPARIASNDLVSIEVQDLEALLNLANARERGNLTDAEYAYLQDHWEPDVIKDPEPVDGNIRIYDAECWEMAIVRKDEKLAEIVRKLLDAALTEACDRCWICGGAHEAPGTHTKDEMETARRRVT